MGKGCPTSGYSPKIVEDFDRDALASKCGGSRSVPKVGLRVEGVRLQTPWASTTIEIMVDPISMVKTLRVQQWWLY